MTDLPEGWTENESHDLLYQGVIAVPVEKRVGCLVYSRVVGYLTPVSTWNKGKRAEWADRVDFDPSLVRKARIAEVRSEPSMNTEPVIQAAKVGGILPIIT